MIKEYIVQNIYTVLYAGFMDSLNNEYSVIIMNPN